VTRRRQESHAERRERRAAVDDPEVVLEAALRFLEARSRSVAEVRRRLGQAGYRAELVEGAIVRLTELGMLDDATFGRAWVESRDRAHPRGERALRSELGLKGLGRDVIDELLAERRNAAPITDDDSNAPRVDLAAAQRLLARNARALDRIADSRTRRQRGYTLLARNGFDPETCREAVAALIADEAGDTSAADTD
jgi:regulatory protein